MSTKIRQDINLGNNIRAMRRRAHLTQEQVVVKLKEHGITSSRSIYSQIECGRYNVRVSELAAFSEIFGVDYNTFFRNGSIEVDKETRIAALEHELAELRREG